MPFKDWWADDRHFIPRIWRDIKEDRVGLYTFTRDDENNIYHLDYVRIPRRDLPLKAIHVTGTGDGEWFHDLVDSGPWPQPGEFAATDYYLHAKSTALDDALAIPKKLPFYIDTKMVVIAGLAIGAIIIVWIMLH